MSPIKMVPGVKKELIDSDVSHQNVDRSKKKLDSDASNQNVARSKKKLDSGDRSGYCVGTDAAILAYYLRILNTKCTLFN